MRDEDEEGPGGKTGILFTNGGRGKQRRLFVEIGEEP